jgi:hypothetical protein
MQLQQGIYFSRLRFDKLIALSKAEGQSFLYVQAPIRLWRTRPPRLHPPLKPGFRAAGPFTPRIARLVTCPGMWHRYVSDTSPPEAEYGGTSTRWIASLSAAPPSVLYLYFESKCSTGTDVPISVPSKSRASYFHALLWFNKNEMHLFMTVTIFHWVLFYLRIEEEDRYT